MSDVRILAGGLGFPEGPVAMADGSVILTEIRNGRCSRVTADGKVSVFSDNGGGPNGLAVGPDGALYCCNNGGSRYVEGKSMGQGPHPDYKFGWIERLDPKTGEAKVLYTECDGHKLSRAQRPGVRHRRRLLLHRSRQALCPPSRPRRHLLRAARRLEDHLPGLSVPQPQRLRPVARRQGALCRRHGERPSLRLRHRGAGRPRQREGGLGAYRPRGRRRPGRTGRLRQPGGAGQRQHLRGHAQHRQDHRVLARRARSCARSPCPTSTRPTSASAAPT